MQREILGQRSTLGDAKNQLRNMHTEIHECVQFIQDPQALKAAVKKIYQRHVSSDLVSSRGVEPDIATEYARQREVLDANPNPNPNQACTLGLNTTVNEPCKMGSFCSLEEEVQG